jgi:anthranilate phosphoribosyltransferase
VGEKTALQVRVDAQDADVEEIAELTRQLRRGLLELDVDAVEPVPGGQAPPGAKAGEALALGGLMVSLVNASGVLASVVAAIQSWVVGHGPRSVKLELDGDVLEVSGISSRRQNQLIKVWLDRHADR